MKLIIFVVTVLISLSFSLPVRANSYIDFEDNTTGSIKLNLSMYPRYDYTHNSSPSYFTAISQLGTKISLLLTSTIYLCNFNTQNNFTGPIPIRASTDFENKPPAMIAPFMAFMSVLGTSVFNYKNGTENDILAVIPVIPTWSGNEFSKNNSVVNFDYGFFLYFSKDF
jgi:hypothetical protein